MDYIIEKAKTKDTEELLTLSRKVTNINSRTYLPKEMVDNFLQSDFFISEVTDNIDNMTVIKDKDKIIGLCVFIENKLQSLMLDPDYQNKGIATYFLQHLEEVYFKKYQELILECFAPNLKANNFYKKNNWILYQTVYDEDLDMHSNLYKKRR